MNLTTNIGERERDVLTIIWNKFCPTNLSISNYHIIRKVLIFLRLSAILYGINYIFFLYIDSTHGKLSLCGNHDVFV